MPHTLSEIVSTALRDAEAGVKVASLRDAPIEDRSLARVDAYLARELGQVQVQEGQKQASVQSTKVAAARNNFDDVRFALKLADALEHGANVVHKLAVGTSLSYDDPAVLKQPFENARVQTPAPQASARARADAQGKASVNGEPTTDEGRMLNEGPVIPENYPNGKNITNHQNSKHASRSDIERLLRSKIAEHRMLVSLGQIEAADAVLKEAQALTESNGSNLVFRDDRLGTVMPDNEGVRNLTKAQARNANQREAGSYFGEPVKIDNAVAAHSASTHGLKLSHRKLARGGGRHDDDDGPVTPGFHESLANHASAVRGNVPLQTIGSGVVGGLYGGLLGHAASGGHGAGTALGAGLGAAGFGALGHYSAKGEAAMRKRLYEEGKRSKRAAAIPTNLRGIHGGLGEFDRVLGAARRTANRGNVLSHAASEGHFNPAQHERATRLLDKLRGRSNKLYDRANIVGSKGSKNWGGHVPGPGSSAAPQYRGKTSSYGGISAFELLSKKGDPASLIEDDGAGTISDLCKTSGFGDLAAGVGRGISRLAGKGLSKLDEGAGLLRQGTMGPHAQSAFSRGAAHMGGLAEGTHKAIGYGAMGAGAAGTGYLGARALGGGGQR